MQKSFLLLLVVIILLVTTRVSFAQDPDYDHINEIASKMNCPTCVGINLADCNTQTCQQWREQIGDLIEQGYSDQEILDYFSTRYGNRVLLEPPKSGSTLFLWILPIIVVAAGGGWLYYLLRRWPKPQAQPVEVSPGVMIDDYLDLVEKDLGN
jgi:cytochrome c-type biogenesis protein CcmH